MEDKDFKKILKCNVPEVELDSKKILYNCKNHKNKMKKLRISSLLVSIVFICLIIGVFLIVLNVPSNDNPEEKNNQTEKPVSFDVNPSKDAKGLVINGFIDYCVAYGVDGINKLKSSELYDLDIISEEDKVILKAMDQKNGVRYINLYFAVKDNKDVIVISYLERPFGEDGMLIFDSNISFPFNGLVDEFEDIIGEDIDYDFLNQRYQETSEQILPSGIYLELVKDNDIYKYKFTLYYKNQEHIIYK